MDDLIERIDEHIETGKSAGEWAEVNNAELVLLLTDIRAALSPVLPEEVEKGIDLAESLCSPMLADLIERLARQVRDHTAYTESLEILHARIENMEEEIRHIAFEGGGTDTMAMRLEKLIDLDPNWIPNPEGT